jgi:hypothetical protein
MYWNSHNEGNYIGSKMNIYKKYDQAPNKGRITGVEIFKHMTYSN